MERKSRALEARDAEDVQMGVQEGAVVGRRQADDHDDVEIFHLPNAEEREKEKESGGIHVQEVRRRIQDCVRVLGDFKKLASNGRSRSEYVEQLMIDMAEYYGYNEFLTEKLFNLFPASEVRLAKFLSVVHRYPSLTS